MSETIIPNFKNETEFKDFLDNNPIYLYNPDRIGELSNEISKLENRLTFSNEYFSQLKYIFGLKEQFDVIDKNENLTPEQKEKSKTTSFFNSINNNYELVSEIVKDNLAAKNLTLTCKHKGKNFIEFTKELNELGVPNYVISGVSTFDPLALLSKEPFKSICNLNCDDLPEPFKEIFQANLVQHAFNVCIQSINYHNGIDNIPPEAFSNPDFIEIIYSGNPNYFTIPNLIDKLSIEDIENIIQLRKNFCENYFKIRQDPRLNKKEFGMDENTEVFDNNFESLAKNLPHENFSSNYRSFLVNQLTIFYINIGNFYNNSIQQNPQLAAILAIIDFKKYPPDIYNPSGVNVTDFANELVNILKNYPQYYQQFYEIVAYYSPNTDFFEAILNNDFIKNNYPYLKEKILVPKLNFISEITGKYWFYINPKVAIYTNKDDSKEAIKALVSLENLIEPLDSNIINLIKANPDKYGPVVKNIMEAKSIEDITLETINFSANLENASDTKILLLRFDLFESIVKKMHEENIETKKINNVINWTAQNFNHEIPGEFSDETIYSNPQSKNSFLYLISKLNDYELNKLIRLFTSSHKAKKMYAEIKNEKKIRDFQNELNKILKQYNENKISQEETIAKLTSLNSNSNFQPQDTQDKKTKEKDKSKNKKSIHTKSYKNKKDQKEIMSILIPTNSQQKNKKSFFKRFSQNKQTNKKRKVKEK